MLRIVSTDKLFHLINTLIVIYYCEMDCWMACGLSAEDYPAAGKGGDTQQHAQTNLEDLTLPELVTLLTEMVSGASFFGRRF